ncbi:MAG: cutinase family protein [Candidatus Sericytochromatia bacterium]
MPAGKVRQISSLFAAAFVAAWTMLLAAPGPTAAAEPCADVEVVFARGTGEPPGVGGIGQAFVDTLRGQVGDRSLNVYAVNYAASSDFNSGIEFARTVVDGIRDAGGHVESTAANCPNTKIVLGGFSQGAVVSGYVTSAEIPPEVPAEFRSFIPQPMPPAVADHVAAVVLFGKPSDAWMQQYGAPPVRIGPLYAGKTLQLCEPNDTICNGTPGGQPSFAHNLYAANGMVGQGAAFAASRL